MAADSHTVVTNESWGSRLGNAIKGVVVGLVLFVAAFPLLFWNEGRAVKRYKTLKEGGGSVVTISVDKIDTMQDGKLVHVTGKATTEETLSDAAFGVSTNALKLRRTVEMYQWEESVSRRTKKKVGGGSRTEKTYSYSKRWSERAIDSSRFDDPAGHENPGTMPQTSTTLTAKLVRLGAFKLSPSLVAKIGGFSSLAVSDDAALPAALAEKARLHDNGFYIGPDPASPTIGDLRIRFEVAMPSEVSVVASQAGDTFEPYVAQAGGTIELLQMGTHSSETMFAEAQASNRMLTWILRLVGFVLMLIGLNMFFRPLSVLGDVLPILGTLLGAGIGIVCFLVTAALSTVTVAIAWVVYRPLLGIALIAVAVVLALLVGGKLRKGRKRQQA
jgi:hypothetical protein